MTKVLIVDDSVSVRKVVERALVARHLQVVAAASGEEAIQRVDAEEPDLVICDVILPDRDGYQVCEHVRGHPRLGRTPVLLISGVVTSTVLQRATEVGSNGVMFKPFAAEDLVRKAHELLGIEVAPEEHAVPAAAPSAPAAAPPAMPVAVAPPIGVAAPMVSAPPVGSTRPGDVADHAGEAPSAWAPALDVKGCLEQFIAVSGVRSAVLADRDGLLIEAAGDPDLAGEATAALAGCLAESSDGLGRELGRGALTGMVLEYESGTLVLHGVGGAAMLAIVVDGAAVLGKVRYYAKKVLPEISRALASEVLTCRA
jgi:CheY-like chemotaxis protein